MPRGIGLSVEATELRRCWPRPNGEPSTAVEVLANIQRPHGYSGTSPKLEHVRRLLYMRTDLFESLGGDRFRVLEPSWPPGAPPGLTGEPAGAHVRPETAASRADGGPRPDAGDWPPVGPHGRG